ncbi:MAG TPA: type II toxin-antitoxin system RelE/ParE family toxin [Bryobacteraceae bacterium]
MAWDVEFSDEFGEWWDGLTAAEQKSVDFTVTGAKDAAYFQRRDVPALTYTREGRPYRVLYAFDPRRAAMLLIGADKTGNNRWYEKYVPVADAIYDRHLRELERGG